MTDDLNVLKLHASEGDYGAWSEIRVLAQVGNRDELLPFLLEIAERMREVWESALHGLLEYQREHELEVDGPNGER